MQSFIRTHLRSIIIVAVLVLLVSLPLPFYSRQWHVLMHIVGAVIFIGNIVVTAAWMILAERTKQPSIIHFAAFTVNRADLLFTLSGVLLIFINGMILAPVYGNGNPLAVSWVVAALVLLILSGVVWAGFLLRYQEQLVQLSAGQTLAAGFDSVFHKWAVWGIIATLLPIVSLILMVFKPTLWG